MVYFISGHRNLSEEEFERFYVRKIERILESDPNPSFVIGDYEGVDIMSQDYLVSKGLEDKITVYHMFTSPRHKNPKIKSTKGGYTDDVSRDSAMTSDSDFDVAYYKPEKGNSGTLQNIKRRGRIY